MEFDLDRTFKMLAHTPAALTSLVRAVDPAWTAPNYGPGTWSVHEIVAHLVYGERTDWMPRAMQIIDTGDAHPLTPFDRAGHQDLASAHSTDDLLAQFRELRAKNIQVVRGLIKVLGAAPDSSAILDRRGQHPALGPVTLRQLLATWLVHDLNHIAQVSKAMAFQYKSEVGPWEAYLSILSPPNPR